MRGPVSELPIKLEDVSLTAGDVTILDRVTLTLAPGAPTALIGPNGSGKTTLLRLAMGLIEPTGGRVSWGGVEHAPPVRRARAPGGGGRGRAAPAGGAKGAGGVFSRGPDREPRSRRHQGGRGCDRRD